MYSKLVFLCLAVASARAAPAATDVVPLEKQQPTVIPIVSQSEELESNGTYKFSYETGNGIKREETSYDKVVPKVQGRSAAGDSNEGGESEESNEVHVQQGSYSYTAPDGTLISVRYIADENGFRPIGDHIPQSIVAAAAAAGSSAEKSGRSLNVADSADSASAPKPAAAPAPKAAAAPAPKAAAAPAAKAVAAPAKPAPEAKSEKPEAAPESASTEASTTEAAKATDSEATTANTSGASPSTTESGTTSASSEVTDASEASTPVETTTKSADATTVAATEEPASTSADASTTESASTAAA